MPFLYNIHTPSKTFAIQHKEDEKHAGLISRIASKAGLSRKEATSLQEGKEGSGLVYEYEGSRWSLEDDDDLEIFLSRNPPSSTSSATFHLNPPHAHAHFSEPASPAKSKSTAASALKDKTKSPVKAKKASNGDAPKSNGNGTSNGDGKDQDNSGVKMKDYASGNVKPAGTSGRELGNVAAPTKKPTGIGGPGRSDRQASAGGHHFPQASHSGNKAHFAPSVRSAKSHRSKWGDDDAEPLWETKKREWLEFQNNVGVRTVLGSVGGAKNVRMLLKPGHRGVYISRPFAIKHNLVPKQFAMGTAGYTGLKSIGLVAITVAGKTQKHQAMISEEEHFDVVLGRSWVEKMNIKVDPIDQTILTYMDNGETIPCDIVVLKDDAGNVITVT
ncbi:uncharacterized protein MKK02DRAFT_20978 [Dioszegia hungarica]|uniref:Uncharacterized protein n=1 Tax=Dioszegia hungarica TaxID=4972 RepID=A0AA38H1D8_9TREE|nr:uncharacterized protein MKK02DRAFT_20978 [Dioszegia hungarica]KAI9632140.1 hypothetical protein MKK02DRAFT_20978 [Dioszegia hungarica]